MRWKKKPSSIFFSWDSPAFVQRFAVIPVLVGDCYVWLEPYYEPNKPWYDYILPSERRLDPPEDQKGEPIPYIKYPS